MADTHTGLDALSQRQKEVLRLIARGHQAKEIAIRLDITERTVKAHTDAARRKLGVATSREAARMLVAAEADHEAPVPEDQWSSRPIDEGGDAAASSAHDPDPSDPAKRPSRLLERSGDGLAAPGQPGRDAADRRDNPVDARLDAKLDTRAGGVRDAGGDGAAGGRLARLKQRLERLNVLQWLGLIVLVALLMALVAAGLFSALLTTLELIQQWHHNGHGMVAP